jgi:hypothetical protein
MTLIDYTVPEAVRAAIGKQSANLDATVIAEVITAVSRCIDGVCNRPDGFVASEEPEARIYAGSGTTVQYLDDCMEITLVEVKRAPTDSTYQTWLSSQWLPFKGQAKLPDFNRLPRQGIMTTAGNGLLFTNGLYGNSWRGFNRPDYPPGAFRRTPTVRVTARWAGFDSIPPQVAQACIIESARIFKLGQSGFADTLASQELGKLITIANFHPTTIAMLQKGRLVRTALG